MTNSGKKENYRQATDGIATCFECGEHLYQWSEKDDVTGNRTFYERCEKCDKQWSTGVVTRAEWEHLSGAVEEMKQEKDSAAEPVGEPLLERAAARKLKKVNDLLMRRKKWQQPKRRLQKK